MGRPMASNLARKGETLVVRDVNPAPVRALVGLGARETAQVQEIAACDVVFTMLPTTAVVEQVIGGACERCGTTVEQRYLEQWFFRITEFAPRLLANLDDPAKMDWSATTVATMRLASQPEGCVVDEPGRQLFVGEEKRGLWRVALDADGRLGDAALILPVGETLHADVEGMAVHRSAQGAWLVVSSQGDDSYVLLDADAPHAVKGRFRVGLNPARGIDAASETDGLDVSAAALGGEYGQGLLVVQDGHKRWPMGRQNFKLVPWQAVMRAVEPVPAGGR